MHNKDTSKYIAEQLNHFFPYPDSREKDEEISASVLNSAKKRYSFALQKSKVLMETMG